MTFLAAGDCQDRVISVTLHKVWASGFPCFSFVKEYYQQTNMGKPTNEHNPPDHDEDPPPSYDESENTAYNPRFLQGNASSSTPAAPIEQQQSQLYPTVPPPPSSHPPVPILQPQQQQPGPYYYQYQTFPVTSQRQYHYYQGRSGVRDRIYINTAERRFPTAIIFFVLGW